MEISPKERCYETLSYLPLLNDQQIIKQIANMLDQGVTPKVESEEIPDLITYFWRMWKLPLFSASSVQEVLAEVRECCSEYPNFYICVIDFDNIEQCQTMNNKAHNLTLFDINFLKLT